MPTYAQLNQRHPSFSVDRHADLCALYDGGERFKARLPRFLPQRPAEHEVRYSLRKQEAVYRNYLGPIIDYFAALLFTGSPVIAAKSEAGEPVLEPGDFYTELREDCTRNGTDVDAFFKDRLTRAMVDGRSWFLVNQPSHGEADIGALSKADFEKAKLGDAWLSAVDAADVYDWEEDETGKLEWAIVHRSESRRRAVSESRGKITESWLFLTPEATETYAITYDASKPPKPEDNVPRIGAATPHRFGRVPLVVLDLPLSLWVANRLETPQLAHFRLSNAQTWGMSSTCYAQPVFHVEASEDGTFKMPTMGAGYGIVMGKDESLEWAAPPAAVYAALGEEIKSHKDEIFRIAHQMALGVENNAAAVGRSAESKASDAESTRVVMLAFSRVVKESIEYVYDMISAARGDEFEWSVDGLDDFAAIDMAGLVESLENLQKAGGIPSRTFHVQMKYRLAEGYLPDIDEKTKAEIKKEIEDNVGDEIPDMHLVELAKMHDLANRIAAQDGGSAKPVGAGAAGGKNQKPASNGGRPGAGAAPPAA